MTGTDAPRRAALVTGGSRGIGLAIAHAAAREGFDLTVAARDPERLAAAAAALSAAGARVVTVAADLAEPDDAARVVAAHDDAFGRLDLLALNAGRGTASPVADTPLRRLDAQYALNLRGSFALLAAAVPLLRATAARPDAAERGVRVVALASLTALAAEAGLAAYGATKAALVALCEAFTLEESDGGVLATAVCPGYVDTDLSAWKRDEIPPGTMIRASDVAEVVLALTRLSRHAVVPTVAMSRPGDAIWRA